jgi:hypothetical protein
MLGVRTIAFATCLTAILVADLYSQGSAQLRTLFQQFQSPPTTDQATEHLLKMGKSNPVDRKYLAMHLPSMIESDPTRDPRPWGNAVRLAGELKIVEAAPALRKWIGFNSGGTLTLAQEARLELNPAAKALAQIGDPSVPNLIGVLDHGNLNERQVAVYALTLIGSPRAKSALRQHQLRESDTNLRDLIDRTLAKE